jgi:hypothetical protein
MSTSASSARDRWSAFCKQIADRHRGLGVEAAQAIAQAGAHASNAWAPFEARMKDLEARIIATWNDKVDATYEAEGVPHDVRSADRAVGDNLAFELQLERDRTELRLFPDSPTSRARAAALHAWEEMVRADRAFRTERSPRSLAALQRYERSQIAYWRVFATSLSKEDAAVHDIAHEVRSRMQGFYELTAEFEECWRNAGRPRAAI